jgi:hypothetical protein
MPSNSDVYKEALALAEQGLRELELSEASLSSIALKASRIARITGDYEMQSIMLYEVGGYPAGPSAVDKDIWKAAERAGRVYKKIDEDGEEKRYAKLESIESMESIVLANKELLKCAQYPMERTRASNSITSTAKMIGKRRSFIYQYLSDIYYELKYSIATGDSFSRIRSNVDSNIAELIPNSLKKFTAIYDNLESENSEDWSNAVHSCRRVLQDLADALYPAREDVTKKINGKDRTIKLGPDAYINRLIAYAEEHSDSARFQEIVGAHMGFLGERLDSVFQAAQKGSHAEIVTRSEADRYVVYTYMVVGDLLSLKQ